MSTPASIWPNLPKLVAKATSLDQAPVPVFWVDESGHIGYSNNQLSSFVGYADDALVNQKLDLLIPSLGASTWAKEWWPILVKDRVISSLSTTFRHKKGMAIERITSIAILEVAGQKFAALYLWPKVNAPTTINNSSTTYFLDSLNECISILDKTGKVHYANPALCNKLGVPATDLIGHSLLDFITPAQSQLKKIWQALQQAQASGIEFECQNMSGEELVLRMNVVPQPGDVEGQENLLVSFVDTTEQHRIARKLKERNASFERLASNIPGFIYKFKMTAEGRFSFPYASIGCQEIFGVDPADVVNDAMPIINTIHAEDIPIFQDSILESASQLAPWNLEARLSTIKDEWKWFHAASRPELQKNGDIIWEGLVMDVTDRKQVEAELAKAKESAEASAAAKAAFLSNISHEIRTPLNAVIGLTRLVLATDLSPIQREYINRVSSSSEVLLGIVNNVLDFSKFESGKLDVEQIEFSLSSVLENVGNILEAKAAEQGLELLIDNYPDDYEHLVGDPLRLEQVLINLCNNAIKFTERGEILISMQPIESQQGSTTLKFFVKDTGIGLTGHQQQKIFLSFTQADNSTTRKYGGTGLGLTICKQLVELMGGEIGVESEVDKGSSFFFTVVLGRTKRSSDKKIHIDPETKVKRILFVDDNQTSCQLSTQMLHSCGLAVKSVDSGKTAIAELNQAIKEGASNLYDLIILDWDMPEMDGIETVRRIKTMPAFSETPILLMVSTYAIDRVKSLIDDNLVNALINKPLIKSKLANVIQDIFLEIDQQSVVKVGEVSSVCENSEALLAGYRVLLAEDNAINQEIAQKILESKGLEVLVVNSGREAVDLLLASCNKMSIDAVLMDLQMPEMDGFEATRLIRDNPNFNAIPIIAMTAHAFASEKEKCLAAGMQAHVSKPIQPTQLFSALAQSIKPKEKQGMMDPSLLQSSSENVADTALATLLELSTVDVNSAKKMLNENESLLNKLLHKFAHDQADTMKKLKRQIDHREHAHAAESAHLIKGIAGNLHITDVFDSAVHLENALKNQSQENIEVLLDKFENNFNQFADELGRISESQDIVIPSQKSRQKKDIITQDSVLETLEQLIDYLDNQNFRAESCLEDLTPFLANFYEQELRQFSDLIMDLNFSAAAEIARNLQKKLSESCPSS